MLFFEITIKYRVQNFIDFGLVWFLYTIDDVFIAVCDSRQMHGKSFKNESVIKFSIDSIGLVPGKYKMRFVLNIYGYDNFDDWPDCYFFQITNHDVEQTGFEFYEFHKTSTYLKTNW